jgi:hypothetical protein
MAQGENPTFFLACVYTAFQNHLLKRSFFPHCVEPFAKDHLTLCMRIYSGLSIAVNWMICVYVCKYYAILITVAL